MSSKYAIEVPHALFSLPRPIDSTSGRTLAGPSYNITGSRKRKRSELVIGTDGECLTIYDVKAPRLLTSHAIPPQTYITASPCCIHTKATSSRPSERFTYAAVRNELGAHKHQVVAFRESLSKTSRHRPLSSAFPVKTFCDIGSTSKPVIHVEAIPNGNDTKEGPLHDLIIVQEGGEVTGYSADLGQERWTTSVGGTSPQNSIHSIPTVSVEHLVDFAFAQSAAVAKTGLLRGRPDLVALLDPTNQNGIETLQRTTVLCMVMRPKEQEAFSQHGHRIHVLAIQPQTYGVQRRAPVQHLIQWKLPNAYDNAGKVAQETEFSFDQASGIMYHLAEGCLAAYEFSALGPRLLSMLQRPGEQIDSFLSMPQTMAITLSRSQISILNIRYQSLQATQNISAADASAIRSRKRKRSSIEPTTAPARLLDFYPRENLVVAKVANELVGLLINIPMLGKKKNSFKAGRLIDSLGQGLAPSKPNAQVAPPTATASTISALAKSDPTFVQLSLYLTQRKPMALSGVVQTLQYLLRSFNTPQPSLPSVRLLTDGVGIHSNGADGNDDLEASVTAAEAAATSDLAFAASLVSKSSLHHRASALKSAITLLGITYPASQVARALREQLERRDILLLIDLLRVDLEQGGWTSRILDLYPNTGRDEEGGEDQAVEVVCKVLTYAIDALGMGAWLGGEASSALAASADELGDEEKSMGAVAEATLSQLRTETAAVLECVQESAFFVGFLAEFLRYEGATAASKAATFRTSAEYANSILQAKDGGAGTTMLPFGVRSAKGIQKTRVGAGGEVQKRSRREVGSALSRRVGKYGFEKIRL